jgi:uncharacterized membrane protein
MRVHGDLEALSHAGPAERPPPVGGPPGAILPVVIDQGTAVLDEDRFDAVGREERGRPVALAILLIVGGLLGLLASFELTLDKFQAILAPHSHLSCDFGLLVQCGKNLASAEGSAFGFPNPIIGLVCFPAPVFVGVSVFLITVSIFTLGTLCPWCMLVWSVVIPMFVATTLFNLSRGHLGSAAGVRRFGSALYGWTPLITLLLYVVVAVIAQLRLNVVAYL